MARSTTANGAFGDPEGRGRSLQGLTLVEDPPHDYGTTHRLNGSKWDGFQGPVMEPAFREQLNFSSHFIRNTSLGIRKKRRPVGSLFKVVCFLPST